MKLYLTYYENSYDGEPENDYEYSDRSDEYIDWGLISCKISSCSGFQEEVEINFFAKENDKIYVVYARYSDGDTFGKIYGKWKIIGIYKNEKEADEIRKSVLNSTIEGVYPWYGYFADLKSCEIESMNIIS